MFNLNNLNETNFAADMFAYSADAAFFRGLCRRAHKLGIQVTIEHDPAQMQDVITLWEGGEELVSRPFDPRHGGHNALYWMQQQLIAYDSWK